MRVIHVVLLVSMMLIISGCYYPGIKGKVIDSATGKPIVGALVVAQWTNKHGFGLTYHTLSKIIETLTDKDGSFSLSGNYNPFVEPPEMIIYKEGYIPWRNDMIFPGGTDKLSKDHEWKNHVTYKLSVFSDKYTTIQISNFLDLGMMGRGNSNVPIFTDVKRKLP
jgi:hypothetical protein